MSERAAPWGAWAHDLGLKLANETRWGVRGRSTHEADSRDGVRVGHRSAVLSAGSGAVDRMRWLPAGDQRVAQILSGDAFDHDHGTGAEGTRLLAGSRGGPFGACLRTEQRTAAFQRSSPAAVGEEAEVSNANQAFR